MTTKRIAILGSTGSIGRSTLDVITAHPGRFAVTALAAFSNADLLLEQYRKFRPEYLCLVDKDRAKALEEKVKGEPVKVLAGEDELVSLAAMQSTDMVLNAVVGAAGLKASLETVKSGKDLALANKESLVVGGPLFEPLLKKTGAKLLPVDSEHSAIWQALNCGETQEVRNIILTASGGPFREWPAEKLKEVTVEQALAHPTWKMGPKITIDSATLANKGLEVIEAVYLFSKPAEQIQVVIHPQSIIHSMVEFVDSSVVAQISVPDMRLPITYALFWPERVESDFGRVDWNKVGALTFEEPDMGKFRALKLAYQAAKEGGIMPAVFNAANEVAVAAFLKKTIRFTEITDIIEATLNKMENTVSPQLSEILGADQKARETGRAIMEKIAC